MRNTSRLIVVFAAAFAGCLNANPLPNLPVPDASGGNGGSGGGTMMPDADIDDDAPVSDADPIPCRRCIADSCATEYAVCNGFAACVGTMECIYVDGCYAKATTLDAQSCVYSCAGKAGIGSPTEPAAVPLSPLLTCGSAACKVTCGGMLP